MNGWVNNRDAGDLRRHRSHYDVIVMVNLMLNTSSEIALLKLLTHLPGASELILFHCLTTGLDIYFAWCLGSNCRHWRLGHNRGWDQVLPKCKFSDSQIANFMGPTWGPPGSCRPQMGPCWPHEPCYQGCFMAYCSSCKHATFCLNRVWSVPDILWCIYGVIMITSSNRNYFRVTGPFVRGIRPSLLNSTDTGQWRGALILSLICAWTNVWANAGELRRRRALYDVTVVYKDI